jgi:3-phosphoglycerate kinase
VGEHCAVDYCDSSALSTPSCTQINCPTLLTAAGSIVVHNQGLLLLVVHTGCYGLDIGPNTCKRFAAAIAKCEAIFWNGPMGRFEVPGFAKGTLEVAQEVGKATGRGCTTILGGKPFGSHGDN